MDHEKLLRLNTNASVPMPPSGELTLKPSSTDGT
jgi:hypothetical protein